jgi:hypothetical protein
MACCLIVESTIYVDTHVKVSWDIQLRLLDVINDLCMFSLNF